MFNLNPIKGYLYGGGLVILAGMVAAIYYYRNDAQQAHDNAVIAEQAVKSAVASYDAAVQHIKERNDEISYLEGEYDKARYEAQQAKDKMAGHDITADLVAHPALTLRAINGGTDSLLGALRCTSNPRCANSSEDTKTRPDTDPPGNVGSMRREALSGWRPVSKFSF